MGAETSIVKSEDAPTDNKSEKDCLDLPRRLFLFGRYQQCLRVLEQQALNQQTSLLQHLYATNVALCRNLVQLSSPSSSNTVTDAIFAESDVTLERLKSIPISLRLQATYNIAAGYLRMRRSNIAAECCVRCLGGVLQEDGMMKNGDDLYSPFSAASALEILLRRVCARGKDVRVGVQTLLNLIRLGCLLCASYINGKLWMGARSVLSAMDVVRVDHPSLFQQAVHLAARDEVGGDDLFVSSLPDVGTFLDPISACIETLVGLLSVAEKEFGHAILAFQKSITCVPGYYPAQWCLSCLSLIPDLSISEKTCDHAMSNVGREKKLHGRWEKGGYVNRVGSSRYFDDSQAGLLLRGCLALSSGELNSALSFFRQANGQSKTSLLAAYGASITLRAGGEEEPARDILVKLVEEMEQLLQRSGSTNGGSVDGGELPFFNGLCVRVDQTIVPATMSQIIWQITQSCMALADYKMAITSLNHLLTMGEQDRSHQMENGIPSHNPNSKLFVFYNGPKDPPLSQMIQAKVYAFLQYGKPGAALECVEGLRGSDIDPALLLYKADALMSLELEEKQDVIISCVQRAVSIFETRHRMFCYKKLQYGNKNSAVEKQQQQQCYHHRKRQKQTSNNDVNGGSDEISLPCTRALALAHNNLALVMVLVLWKLGRHKAAAELWLESRGHLPYLSVERAQQLLRQARHHKAALMSCTDDSGSAAVYKGSTRDGGGISAIVNATGEEGCIPASQECVLDVMVLSFWLHCADGGKDE